MNVAARLVIGAALVTPLIWGGRVLAYSPPTVHGARSTPICSLSLVVGDLPKDSSPNRSTPGRPDLEQLYEDLGQRDNLSLEALHAHGASQMCTFETSGSYWGGIWSDVVSFKSAAGAHWLFGRYLADLKGQRGKLDKSNGLRATGNEAAVLTYVSSDTGKNTGGLIRRGRYFATIGIYGDVYGRSIKDDVTVSEKLLRVLDGRLRKAS